MNSTEIRQLLDQTFVRDVEQHEILPSTNQHALSLCDIADERLPYLIIAEQQTNGRGRGEKQWWSSAGSLTFSLVIDPSIYQLEMRNWPLLSVATGLAIAEALQDYLLSHDVQVKWPNDVYVNGRKICGTLIEPIKHSKERLVVGVGINVHNRLDDAPGELRAIATSMIDLMDAPLLTHEILIRVLGSFESIWSRVAESRSEIIGRISKLCYLRGRTVQIETERNIIDGRCNGIHDDGALLVETKEGEQRIYAGVVSHM